MTVTKTDLVLGVHYIDDEIPRHIYNTASDDVLDVMKFPDQRCLYIHGVVCEGIPLVGGFGMTPGQYMLMVTGKGEHTPVERKLFY